MLITRKLRWVTAISMLFAAGFVYIQFASPENRRQYIEASTSVARAEISYRHTYSQLVEEDQQNGHDFLLGQVSRAAVVDEHSPYLYKNLDSLQANSIISLLNDTSTYAWGEWGTPEIAQTIFYYNNEGHAIGYTKIDPLGEVDNYPYLPLMKWGMMTDTSFANLQQLLN